MALLPRDASAQDGRFELIKRPIVKSVERRPFPPEGSLIVFLQETGGLELPSRSLNELAGRFQKATRAYHKHQVAKGRSGFELVGTKKVSLLPVWIIADRDAVWLHIQWIMTVCAEQGLRKLRFRVQAGQARGWIEVDLAVAPVPARGFFVHIEAAKQAEVLRGPKHRMQRVWVPTQYSYRSGDDTSLNLADVRRWAKGHGVAAVRATPNASFQQAISVLEALEEVDRVELFARIVPSERQRASAYLRFGRKAKNPPPTK